MSDTTTDYWNAPNIGLAKITSTTTGTALTAPVEFTEELVGFRAGTRTTDAVAPTVTAVAPAAGSTVSAGVQVQVRIDEALYGESIDPALLRVPDGSDRAVAGTVVVEGAVLRCVNTQPWAEASPSRSTEAGLHGRRNGARAPTRPLLAPRPRERGQSGRP